MAEVTNVVKNSATRITAVMLPDGVRVRPEFPVTGGPVLTSNLYSTLTVVALTKKLYRGSDIRFPGGVTVRLRADAIVGATSLLIVPQTFALPAAAAGLTFAEAEIFGADNATVTGATGEVDISSFSNGVDVEMMTVSVTREASVSGIFTKGNGAMVEIVRPLGLLSEFAEREAHVRITTGDGVVYSGSARFTNYTDTIAFRDVLKFSTTVKFQSDFAITNPA